MGVEATTGTFATGDTNAAAADEEGARATRERQGAKEGSSTAEAEREGAALGGRKPEAHRDLRCFAFFALVAARSQAHASPVSPSSSPRALLD